MAVLATTNLTLADYRKRMAPDGSVDFIIENLENSNPILDDMVIREGNLPIGNRTTIRTSKPRPQIRLLNRGVTPDKSTTKQVQDNCMMLEARSEVDIEEIRIANNSEAFRKSEDAAFIQGFSDVVAENLFYGDTSVDPRAFNGLTARYGTLTGDKGDAGYQVISGGTASSSAKNTSAFFVGWGDHATASIYPKNTSAGLSMEDLGQQTVTDADGGKYEALVSKFNWKIGLAVQDIRANALVRNIDVANLPSTATAKLALVEKFVIAKNRIRNLQNRKAKNVVLYVGDSLYNWFEMYLLDKNNVHVTRKELMDDVPQLYFSGIKIVKCDAIIETESAIS